MTITLHGLGRTLPSRSQRAPNTPCSGHALKSPPVRIVNPFEDEDDDEDEDDGDVAQIVIRKFFGNGAGIASRPATARLR